MIYHKSKKLGKNHTKNEVDKKIQDFLTAAKKINAKSSKANLKTEADFEAAVLAQQLAKTTKEFRLVVADVRGTIMKTQVLAKAFGKFALSYKIEPTPGRDAESE